MQPTERHNREGLFKGITAAYVLLLLHLLLIAGLGMVVIFLTGLHQYLSLIFLGGLAVMALVVYLLFRRLRREGRSLSEALRAPMFRGRSVELSLMGGLATLRLGSPAQPPALEDPHPPSVLQLEDPHSAHIREIETLAALLEKKLITPEEFSKAKQRLLGP